MGKKQSINPINLLRDFVMKGKRIKLKEGYLYFENQKLSLKTETAWLSKKTEKRYDLGSLWLFMWCQEQKLSTVQYLQKKNELKVQMVSTPDQEEILNYFSGKITYTEHIDLNLENKARAAEGQDEVSKRVKREVDENDKEADSLRQIELLYRIERPIESKNKALRKANKSFSSIVDYINLLKEEGSQKQAAPAFNQQVVKQNNSFLDEILFQDDQGTNKPIIIVPLAFLPGNICISNATSFLLDGKYLDINALPKTSSQNTFLKNLNGRQAVFEVRSDEKVLEPAQWYTIGVIFHRKRVVAAFITGSNNEFRKWPDGDQPALLFNKIKGFFLRFHDVPVPPHVKNYNVKQLVMHRNRRHLDVYQKNIFWQELEQFLVRPRPTLS